MAQTLLMSGRSQASHAVGCVHSLVSPAKYSSTCFPFYIAIHTYYLCLYPHKKDYNHSLFKYRFCSQKETLGNNIYSGKKRLLPFDADQKHMTW